MDEKQLITLFHDLKNDFAAMAALTNLHRSYAETLDSAELLARIQQRQIVISTAYELLYQHNIFPNIILEGFIATVFERENILLGKYSSGIKTELKIDDLRLPLKKALPAAQIAAELLSNSYRHAFSPLEPDKSVGLKVFREDGNITMEYSDNGRGLNPEFDPLNARSLGIQLIRSLSKQIGGSPQFESGARGLTVRIVFERMEN